MEPYFNAKAQNRQGKQKKKYLFLIWPSQIKKNLFFASSR